MEELHEEPENSRTPIIILGVAAALVVIVGCMSFLKYVAAKSDEVKSSWKVQTPSATNPVAGITATDEPSLDTETQRIRDEILGNGGVLVQDDKAAPKQVKPTEKEGDLDASDINQLMGRVLSFDADWNIITVDSGSAKGVKVGQMFLLKKGDEPLGKVKIQQVTPTQSVASFVAGNKVAGALKPEVGDRIYK